MYKEGQVCCLKRAFLEHFYSIAGGAVLSILDNPDALGSQVLTSICIAGKGNPIGMSIIISHVLTLIS